MLERLELTYHSDADMQQRIDIARASEAAYQREAVRREQEGFDPAFAKDWIVSNWCFRLPVVLAVWPEKRAHARLGHCVAILKGRAGLAELALAGKRFEECLEGPGRNTAVVMFASWGDAMRYWSRGDGRSIMDNAGFPTRDYRMNLPVWPQPAPQCAKSEPA